MASAKAPRSLFPTLSGGPGGRRRSETERHQRGRLEGAMVEAVSRHGYAETTVGELVALAGVSKSTFYQCFETKEACYFATFDTILGEVTSRVGIAYRSETTGLREQIAAAMTRFAEILAEETAAASLVVVDSLSLGAVAVEPRERAAAAFELLFRQSFENSGEGTEPSDLEVRAIVAGIRRVVYRCLRADCAEEVSDHLEELLEWSLSYQGGPLSPPSAPRRPHRGMGTPSTGRGLDWGEPPDSERSRASLSQRERIIRAAAQLAAKDGFTSLTIPAISATSGTSNQTFYEHFDGKEQAFLAAFDEVARHALRATATASTPLSDWPTSVEEGMRGLLEHLVAEPIFAQLAFFELPTAGAAALDRADVAIQSFTSYLEPEALPEGIAPQPPVVVEAIGGGMWAVIQHEIAAGRLPDLPEKAAEIAAISLVPFASR